MGLPVLGVVENMSELRLPAKDLRFLAKQPEGAGEAEDVTAKVLETLEAAMPGISEQLLASAQVLPTGAGGAQAMCKSMGVPFLGSIPLDPKLAFAADKGQSIHEGDGEAKAAIHSLIDKILAGLPAK